MSSELRLLEQILHELQRGNTYSVAQIQELAHILAELREQTELLEKLVEDTEGKPAQSATLEILDSKGNPMPLQVHVNDKPGMAIFTEFDGPGGTGNKVPPVGAVSFASDNAAVATVDPSTGALAYVSAGVANISGTDAGNSLTASDALTVIASVAVSATLTLQPGA